MCLEFFQSLRRAVAIEERVLLKKAARDACTRWSSRKVALTLSPVSSHSPHSNRDSKSSTRRGARPPTGRTPNAAACARYLRWFFYRVGETVCRTLERSMTTVDLRSNICPRSKSDDGKRPQILRVGQREKVLPLPAFTESGSVGRGRETRAARKDSERLEQRLGPRHRVASPNFLLLPSPLPPLPPPRGRRAHE